MNTNLNPSNLAYFCGTESYTWGPMRRFVMTDGVTYLCANGAAWFVELIASYQNSDLRKNAHGYQFWRLTPNKQNGQHAATAVCDDGNGNILRKQEIEFTDFPFDRFNDKFEVWVQEGYVPSVGNVLVALLPSEH